MCTSALAVGVVRRLGLELVELLLVQTWFGPPTAVPSFMREDFDVALAHPVSRARAHMNRARGSPIGVCALGHIETAHVHVISVGARCAVAQKPTSRFSPVMWLAGVRVLSY